MEKKSTLLLTVVAIATLLVAVVGATFAYFASSAETSNNVVVVNTASAAAFSSTVNKAVEIYADATNMANVEGYVGEWDGNDTVNVNVKLAGSVGTYCTYDVVFIEDENSDEYVPSDDESGFGGGFTVSSELQSNAVTTTGGNAVGTSTLSGEVEYNELFSEYPIPAEPEDVTDTYGYIVQSGKITIVDSTTTTYDLHVNFKFSNLESNQLANAGKTFKGTLEVTNIACFDQSGQSLGI